MGSFTTTNICSVYAKTTATIFVYFIDINSSVLKFETKINFAKKDLHYVLHCTSWWFPLSIKSNTTKKYRSWSWMVIPRSSCERPIGDPDHQEPFLSQWIGDPAHQNPSWTSGLVTQLTRNLAEPVGWWPGSPETFLNQCIGDPAHQNPSWTSGSVTHLYLRKSRITYQDRRHVRQRHLLCNISTIKY